MFPEIDTCFFCSQKFDHGSTKFNYHENYVCERCQQKLRFLRSLEKNPNQLNFDHLKKEDGTY